MKNLYFNTDGPKHVSEKDFKTYQELSQQYQPLTFDHLFYIWVDENYSDGVRRLCLRDLLRQHSIGDQSLTKDSIQPYYRTDVSFERLLHLGGRDKPTELYWHLHNRPRLLAEFIEEFQYLLERLQQWLPSNWLTKHYARFPSSTRAKHTLLEIIFQLSDQETGLSLLPYYDIWNTAAPDPESATKLLQVLADPHQPRWLHNILNHALSAAIAHEIESLHIEPSKNGCALSSYLTPLHPVLDAVMTFLNRYDYQPEKKDLILFESILLSLQQQLPKNICILPFSTLMPISYALQSRERILLYARHYIMSGYTEGLSAISYRDASQFYFFLRGLAAHYRPKDTKFIAALEEFHVKVSRLCYR